MVTFPRYESYKDSGVEWLGEIPSHWELMKVSHSFRLIGSGTTPQSGNVKYHEDGEICWVNTGDLNDGHLKSTSKYLTKAAIKDHSTLKMYTPGTVLMAMYGATIGKAAILDFEACTNQACCALSDSKFHIPKFIFYWLLGNRQSIIAQSYGGGQPNISQEIIKALKISTPPIAEQQRIVEFLDRTTTDIDRAIAQKQRLIELLQEQKAILINQAVTKGLNPNVPMRDSGLPWLGKVPENWEIKKLKWFAKTESGATPDSGKWKEYYENGDINWVRTLDLNDGEVWETEVKITQKAVRENACRILPVDTVMIAMYGGDGTIGKNGILRIPAATNQAVCAILPNPIIVPEFLHKYIQFYRPHWMFDAVGARKDPNISQEIIRELTIPVPSVSEQLQILEFLKNSLATMENIGSTTAKEIEILREYTAILISHAVTGKIKV